MGYQPGARTETRRRRRRLTAGMAAPDYDDIQAFLHSPWPLLAFSPKRRTVSRETACLFPDTEAAEKGVEDMLDIDSADDAAQRPRGGA